MWGWCSKNTPAPHKDGFIVGLFDEIHFEPRLPLPEDINKDLGLAIDKFFDEEEFQTKDFENLMEKYVVTAKGKLKRKIFYSDKTKFYQESELVKIDKSITCYGIVKLSENTSYWLEYEIVFKNGIMVTAKVLDWHEMGKSDE